MLWLLSRDLRRIGLDIEYLLLFEQQLGRGCIDVFQLVREAASAYFGAAIIRMRATSS